MQNFRDILADRRNECSNFMWVSRRLSPRVPCERSPRPTPKWHKRRVEESRAVREFVAKLRAEGEADERFLREKVRRILDEIGYDKQLTTVRWLGLFLTKVCCRVCDGIYVNVESLEKLKSQMGRTPMVYVPSHRSYADFILMSFVLFSCGVEIPAIAAGMDFHGMKGMGTVLRNTGAFFMRRTYNDDPLYWATFRQYVHQLITQGDIGIEFFIEGTRSRSCKTLPPKFGLLTMLLKSFITGEVPDILFVPINISYDRVMEERLFAFEHLGVPKPKESTSGFFKSLSMVREHYGSIYVNFGEAISTRETLNIDRSKHVMKPIHMQQLSTGEKLAISGLAERIVANQQRLSVATAFNLIALILTNNLIQNENIMRLEQLIEDIVWAKGVVERCGGLTDVKFPRKAALRALEVHANLVTVDEASNVKLVQSEVVLGNFDSTRLKGHGLSSKTMTVAVPFVLLQIYVNPVLHHLIPHAILTAAVKNCELHYINKDRLFEEYTFLCSLFYHEFVLFENRRLTDFWRSLSDLIELKAVAKLDDFTYTVGSNEKLQTLLVNILSPFLVTYYVVCTEIRNMNLSVSVAEKRILADVQRRLEVAIDAKRTFVHPYSLSLDTIANCLSNLVKSGTLTKHKTAGGFVYDVSQDVSLVCVINKIEKYVPVEKRALWGTKNKL